MAQPAQWYPAAPPEKGVVGRFEWFKQLDLKASREADEPRYREIMVIRMKASASSDESVVPVKPHNQHEFQRRFPEAWQAFQGQEVKVGGTPLSDLGFDDTLITRLRLHAIMNVETLADLSDIGCQNVGFGTTKLRQAAKDHLAAKASARLAAALEAAPQPAEPAKRRGRPPKKPADAQATAH